MIRNITVLSKWTIFYKSETFQSTEGGPSFVSIILPARNIQMGVTKEGEVGCVANPLPLALMYTQVGFLWSEFKWKYGGKKQLQRPEGGTTVATFCQWNLMDLPELRILFYCKSTWTTGPALSYEVHICLPTFPHCWGTRWRSDRLTDSWPSFRVPLHHSNIMIGHCNHTDSHVVL